MKNFVKRNNEEISAYLCNKYFECCIINIIQHYPTDENNDSNKDVSLH